jgi:DNA-directed RNA polymerase subunit RPC12/RpoP
VFRNIYRLDNFLFLLGFLSLPLMMSLAFRTPVFLRPLLFTVPFCLWGVALYIHREERRILRIWTVLEKAGSISIRDLGQLADAPRSLILKSIPLINRASGHVFLLDAHRDVVVDRAQVRILQIEAACEACGATVNEEVEIEPGSGVACPYCSNPLLSHTHVLERLEAIGAPEQTAAVGPSFNYLIFGLLMMVFWPAGIWYLTSRSASRRLALLNTAR